MLFDEAAVRANVRNREGKRVFYLGKNDTLTPSARDWLSRERIEILPGELAKPQRYRLLSGGYMEEKPEHMTHLDAHVLVPKTHPRIVFRGKMDTLEAELLLCQAACDGEIARGVGEILLLARRLVRCEVLSEDVGDITLCGLTEAEQRKRSHFPQDYYGQPHFMPEASDGKVILLLNRCRCAAREAELAAAQAFSDAEGLPARPDLMKALNRMSSMLYLLMIGQKAQGEKHVITRSEATRQSP